MGEILDIIRKEKLLPVNFVARVLNVSVSTVYRKVEEGKLKGVRLSERKLMIIESSLNAHLAEINEDLIDLTG